MNKEIVVTPNLNKKPVKVKPAQYKKVIGFDNAGRVFKIDDPLWNLDLWYASLEYLEYAEYTGSKWEITETLAEYGCQRKKGQHGFCKSTWGAFKEKYGDALVEQQQRYIAEIRDKLVELDTLAKWRKANGSTKSTEIRDEHNAIMKQFKHKLLGRGRYGKSS